MDNIKVYTLAYINMLLIVVVGLMFGFSIGVLAFFKECYEYMNTKVKPTIKETLEKMKEEIKNVD